MCCFYLLKGNLAIETHLQSSATEGDVVCSLPNSSRDFIPISLCVIEMWAQKSENWKEKENITSESHVNWKMAGAFKLRVHKDYQKARVK